MVVAAVKTFVCIQLEFFDWGFDLSGKHFVRCMVMKVDKGKKIHLFHLDIEKKI